MNIQNKVLDVYHNVRQGNFTIAKTWEILKNEISKKKIQDIIKNVDVAQLNLKKLIKIYKFRL